MCNIEFSKKKKKPLMYNLLLRTVTSCAMASFDGSGPKPHLARR